MKKHTDKRRAKVNDYRIRDLVMLSTKDLKYQMIRRRTKKLTEVCRALQSEKDHIIECS